MNERAKKLYQAWNDWRAQLYDGLDQLRVNELHVYEDDLREVLARIRQAVASRDGERQAFAVGDRITTSLGRSRAVPGVVSERSYDAAAHTWSYRVQTDDGASYWLRITAERNNGTPPVPERALKPLTNSPSEETTPTEESADFFTQ